MSNSVNSYEKLSDKDKKQLLEKKYVGENLSFANIAKEYDTYPNKLRRDAIKFQIKIRDKSEAQKNALATGAHKHPTKGQQRSENIKQKIGKAVMESWENLSDSEIEDRKSKSRQQWEALDKDKQQYILKKANEAVRQTSKTGSKLEKYIFNRLLSDGFKVDFHKEQTLLNTKLQIDLFIPAHNIAIEVDGPSHFEPVWGGDSLKRNKKYDAKKEGLILGKGWKLIRVKQTKDFSKTRAEEIYQSLLQSIQELNTSNQSSTINIKDY